MKYRAISTLCLGILTVFMLQIGAMQGIPAQTVGETIELEETEQETEIKEDSTAETSVETGNQIATPVTASAFSLLPSNVANEDSKKIVTAMVAEEIQVENTANQSEETSDAEKAEKEEIEKIEVIEAEESEYADLAIADVTNYVNVRMEPDTESAIAGKIYDGAVAQILETAGEENDWFKVISGNVEGYIKSEFFLYGEEAVAVIDDYVTRYAVVLADRLNVRENPDLEAKRIGFIDNGEKVKILENQGDWLKVQYTTQKAGYVASEYVTISEEFVYAKTLEEEAAEIAARKEMEARQNVSESAAAENVAITVSAPSGSYSSNSELRSAIVEYAMQFLGNKYVHGGKSLQTGTDCSGFTSLIYAEFGFSVSRTPSGQLSNDGTSIAYSEIQPGDIICYGSSGKCTHVALYIGDGQIIHSANSKKGVVIYNADYDTILGVKKLID